MSNLIERIPKASKIGSLFMNLMKRGRCEFLLLCALTSLSLDFASGAEKGAKAGSSGQATAEVLTDGFDLTVFAGPPNIEYPTSLTAAPDGTVYVSVDQNGSLGKGRPGRVVACRDNDGDGRADQFWDYIPDVLGPRGGDMVAGKFYLIHPPFLSVFWDADGDGVAERSKQLVDGLGTSSLNDRGGDHTTNGVRMGIDGWLYISVGDFGMSSATGTDGRVVSLHGGGVARVRPDGSELEVYSYNTRNQCDVAISPRLDLFTRDNTNDGKGWNVRVHHFTNLSEHGYPRLYKNFADEAVKPLLDLGGGSGTGALYLHEPGFPDGLGDSLFTCDWTTGKVHSHGLTPFEATFQATESVFMKLTRATDIDVDGLSRLYTSDWRNGRFNYAGKDVEVGLIHRLKPQGFTPEPWPDFTTMDVATLVDQLYNRSAKRRLEAQQAILIRGDFEAFRKPLMAAISERKSVYGDVAAIFTLKQLGGVQADSSLLTLLGKGGNSEFLIRALGDRRTQASALSSEELAGYFSHESARVRLQAAIAAERLQRVEVAGELLSAASRSYHEDRELEGSHDYRFPHTAVQALARLKASDACLAAVKDPATRGIALAALKLISEEKVIAEIANQLSQTGTDHSLSLQLMEVLARLVHRERVWDETSWWQTRPDDRGPYFERDRWKGSETAVKALEEAFARLPDEKQETALLLFGRNRLDITEMELGAQDPVAMVLMMPSPSESQLPLLVAGSLDSKRDWDERLACYRALSKSPSPQVLQSRLQVLAGWAGDDTLGEKADREINDFINSPSLSRELRLLGKVAKQAPPAESEIAWKAIFTLSRSPLISKRYLKQARALANSKSKALGYFLALQDLKFSGFEKAIESAINGDNRALSESAKAAKAAIAEASQAKNQEAEALIATLDPIEVTKQVMVANGNLASVALGKKLYTQQACASCHAVELAEVQKGPYLGSAGSKFERNYLIESILDPGATVAQGFVTVLITMNDGAAHMGFVTREEDGEVDLRNIGGVVTTLRSEDIAKRELQPTSMMPPGLASSLTVSEFTALIDYLVSLREE